MRVTGDVVEFGYRHHEARFRIVGRVVQRGIPAPGEGVVGAGKHPGWAPDRCRCAELAVWRYITVPGVPELALERRLLRIPGVQVAMWPGLDL
jgi:hypothetical protein